MALKEDSKQTSSSLIIGWSAGSKLGLMASSAALFRLIRLSSSQCVAINNSVPPNIFSSTNGFSTNKLPVDDPINIFNPQTSFFLSLVFKISSKLS